MNVLDQYSGWDGTRHLDEVHALPLPPHPTDALPGTRAKVAVMARRIHGNVAARHPGDATTDGDSMDPAAMRNLIFELRGYIASRPRVTPALLRRYRRERLERMTAIMVQRAEERACREDDDNVDEEGTP